MRWHSEQPTVDKVEHLRHTLGIGDVLAGLLAKRDIADDVEKLKAYITPRLLHLEDPFGVTHIAEAVDRLIQAMSNHESILILGDYDVDGVTSTTLLVSILRRFSIEPKYVLPRRLEEGYGLTQSVIERILEEEGVPDLFIALDCGTNSVEEVTFLKSRGADVIIIDHHRSKEEIPEDCILVNPHVLDDASKPWVNLCTVGLVFKFVHGLIKRLREQKDPIALEIKLKNDLDLVALGTVADLVTLEQENRILTSFGLKQMEQSKRVGLNALFEVSGLALGQAVHAVDVSFRLGPRINASGRLGDAMVPVEMLLSEDPVFCQKAAQQVDAFNKERQSIERGICEEAERRVAESDADTAAVVVWDESWHQGVVGIVAGKLARQLTKPSVVLCFENGIAKGSGRSIAGLNLTKVLAECDELLETWGGHPMAVGISIKEENLKAFKTKFIETVKTLMDAGEFEEPCLEIAWWVEPREVGADLLKQIDQLHPFGEGNPEPIFGVRNVVLAQPPETFGAGHFRFYLPTKGNHRVSGIAWGKGDRVPPIGKPIELAIKLSWNQWNGQRYPQIELIDWRYPE